VHYSHSSSKFLIQSPAYVKWGAKEDFTMFRVTTVGEGAKIKQQVPVRSMGGGVEEVIGRDCVR